jgi:hypothetical protein
VNITGRAPTKFGPVVTDGIPVFVRVKNTRVEDVLIGWVPKSCRPFARCVHSGNQKGVLRVGGKGGKRGAGTRSGVMRDLHNIPYDMQTIVHFSKHIAEVEPGMVPLY